MTMHACRSNAESAYGTHCCILQGKSFRQGLRTHFKAEGKSDASRYATRSMCNVGV
jgi:hypothetical protein